MKSNLIIAPDRATIPDDLGFPICTEKNIIDKIVAGRESECIVTVNTRELQLLSEYRDMLNVDLRAIIGLTGAMYNTIWSTYVSTMTRVTPDSLRVEAQERNDERADAGQREDTSPVIRQSKFAALKSADDDDDEAIGVIE